MAKQMHPYGYWTDDKIIEESKKYKSKTEFKTNAPTAYKKANEKKLMKGMTWLKTDRQNGSSVKCVDACRVRRRALE